MSERRDDDLYNLVKRSNDATDKTRKTIEDYIVMFSCHDFRLGHKHFGVSKTMLNWIVNKLRRMVKPGWTTHIRDLRPLNIGTIVLIVRDPQLVEELRKTKLIRDIEKLVPIARFVSSASFTLDGKLFLSYAAPREILNDMLAEIDSWAKGRDTIIDIGETIPVHNCTGKIGLDNIDSLARYFDSIRDYKPFRSSRMPILDYILISVLDMRPLINMVELHNVMYAVRARIERDLELEGVLRKRYVMRHYRRLSELKILGRVKFSRKLLSRDENLIVIFMTASTSCLRKIYAIVAGLLASSRITVTGKRVYAGMSVPSSLLPHISGMLTDCDLETHVVTGGKISPFPFEMFDPRRNEWRLEPVEVLEFLKRTRVLG